MTRAARRALLAASLVLLAGGGGLVGFAAGRALFRPASLAPAAYVEQSPCSACPTSISLDSVELQGRQGSTLLIIRGRWPSSVDALKGSVRLVANDIELVLKPHGSKNAFELATAKRAGTPLPKDGVAAGLQQGALLINLTSAILAAPIRFDLGLWDGQAYTGRLPRSGQLVWTGQGAPKMEAVPATSQPPASPPGLDLTALARSCDALPSGSVPPYLHITGLTSGTQTDPRTQVLTPSVTAALAGSPVDVTVPFSITATVLHAGDKAPTSQRQPIDRSGTVQLWVYSDGQARHKGIRTFTGGKWTMRLDAEADALTYRLSSARSATFYWAGLQPGDRFGFVTSAATGCAASGLDGSLAPLQPLS